MMSSTFDTLESTRRRLQNGETTALALTEQALARIEASQPTLNAFRAIRKDEAIADARAADKKLAQGSDAPLLGVPVAMKDDMDLAGFPTFFGTRCHPLPAARDAEMVRRLKAAGAIIVGRAHSSELGQWPLTGTGTPETGHTHNPWQKGRTAGGSSGGSAAAVAAGLVPVAMGSDGAGSIRIPAAWNHLVGIKPQRGRIPTSPWPEMFNGLTVLGPLARTVRDATLLLDAVSGPCPSDIHQPEKIRLTPWADKDPGRLRIALSLKPPFTAFPVRPDPEIVHAVERLAAVLESLGHDVIIADPPYPARMSFSFLPRSLAGIHEWVERFPDPVHLDPRTRHNATHGKWLKGAPLRAARRAEDKLQTIVGKIFRRADVVLAPCTATPPPPVDAIDHTSDYETTRRIIQYCPYTWPWNVLGWPGINVPAGFNQEGLPIGAQLLGPANSEPRLVALAAQLETVEKWHEKRPASWW